MPRRCRSPLIPLAALVALSVAAIAAVPQNASRSTYAGTGVCRTADAGKTWRHMGLADTHPISRIVVSPTNSRVIWVAAQGPLYTDSEQVRDLVRTGKLTVKDMLGLGVAAQRFSDLEPIR